MNILSLINPARIINREGLMKLAEEIVNKRDELVPLVIHEGMISSQALILLQRFESLYALKLEKGHFVCERDKPIIPDTIRVEIYEAAQAKVIFEGFEECTKSEISNGRVSIWFPRPLLWIENRECSIETIRDLLYHIEKYNETAAQKIELKYTSNILSLLKIEG